MADQRDGPDEDIETRQRVSVMDSVAGWIRCLPHPSSNGEPLEGKVLRVFKDKVTDVKYGSEPGRTKHQTRASKYQGQINSTNCICAMSSIRASSCTQKASIWSQVLTDWLTNSRLGCHLSEETPCSGVMKNLTLCQESRHYQV